MPAPSYDFSNRAAVVTGAGGGMGEAIALALAKAGAAVTAIDVFMWFRGSQLRHACPHRTQRRQRAGSAGR